MMAEANGFDPVEEYRRLLSGLPGGLASSIELLAGQLSDRAERLLRLSAIPHSIDMEVASVLAPDIAPADLEQTAEELRELSFVIRTSEGAMLHDEVRRYLFGQWLDAYKTDAEKWGLFKTVSARLADYYGSLREKSVGEASDVAERQRIFHLIGADTEQGFAEFQNLCRTERHNLRLGACEALINLVREYAPVLSATQQSWLDYHDAKLLLDMRHYEKAKDAFDRLIDTSDALGDEKLWVRSLYRLAGVLRELREFERARATFLQLLTAVDADESAVDQKIHAMQGYAALLIEMEMAEEAEAILDDSLSLAQRRGDHSALAACWNTMGILHRKFGRPQRALDAFRNALKELELGGETFRTGQVYNNIGLLHADRAEWDEAQLSLEMSLDIARTASDLNGEAKALSNLGRVYLAQGMEGQAVTAAEKSIQIFTDIHNWFGAAATNRGLARYYRREDRIAESRAAFLRAREMFLRANSSKEAEECEAEAERVGTGGKPWGWIKWTFAVIGGLVALILFVSLLVLLIE